MPRPQTLQLLDQLLAEGRDTITTRELQQRLGRSPQATSNLLTRLASAGLVDRIARGRYALRPLGLLGTRAASEDVALAVGGLLGGEPHRIGYLSALEFNDLLIHPSRVIQVASPRRITLRRLSGRPFQSVREAHETIQLGGDPAGHGAWVSGHERSLLDAASRLDLVGGLTTLAAALHARRVDPGALQELARKLDAGAALRRIGSLADQLGIPGLDGGLTPLSTPQSDLDLDPSADTTRTVLRDPRWRIRWPLTPEELANAVQQ